MSIVGQQFLFMETKIISRTKHTGSKRVILCLVSFDEEEVFLPLPVILCYLVGLA